MRPGEDFCLRQAALRAKVTGTMKTDAETNDAYRAIGRWFVEFSRLIFHMRHALERRLAGDQDIMVPILVLGEAPARQIADSFFGVCAYLADFDEAEAKVATRLKNMVVKEIQQRNNFAHGDWWVGPNPADEGHEIDDPMLWRTKGGQKELPAMKTLPATEIDKLSDGLYELRQYIGEFGDLCMGGWPGAEKVEEEVRVEHVFRINEADRLVRDGPAVPLVGKLTYH